MVTTLDGTHAWTALWRSTTKPTLNAAFSTGELQAPTDHRHRRQRRHRRARLAARHHSSFRSLDALEKRLPPAPRMLFKLNRSIASLGCRLVGRAIDSAADSTRTIASRVATGTRTVQGQARSAAERTAAASAGAAKEVVGQARAQTEQVLDTIDAEAQSLVEDADDAIEGTEAGSYTGWTKAEIYDALLGAHAT